MPETATPEPDQDKVKSTVDGLLQGVHATATLSGIALAKKDTERARAVVLAYQDDTTEEAEKARRKLEEAEANLAKLAKKKPSPAEERVAISLAKDAYEARVAARQAKVDAAVEKYETRAEWRRKCLAALEQQLADAKLEVEDQEQTLQNAYEEKERCKTYFDSAVHAALDGRLSTLNNFGPQPDEPEAPPTPPTPQPNPEIFALRTRNEEISKQLAEVTRLYELMQQQLQQGAEQLIANNAAAPTDNVPPASQNTHPTTPLPPASSATTSTAPAAAEATTTAATAAATAQQTEEAAKAQRAADKARWEAECARIAALGLNPRDPADPEIPDLDDMPAFARAHQVVLATAMHQTNVVLTFTELGLRYEHLQRLLGPVYDRIYVDERKQTRDVPFAIPKTVTNLVGIALTKLAARLTDQMKADAQVLDEAYNVVEQAATRRNPY